MTGEWGASEFFTTASTASPSCARSVCGFDVTSLSFHKEVTKKRSSDVPSEASLLPAVLTMNGGGFWLWQESSILGAYIARPRWVSRGKSFCRLVLLKISANKINTNRSARVEDAPYERT